MNLASSQNHLSQIRHIHCPDQPPNQRFVNWPVLVGNMASDTNRRNSSRPQKLGIAFSVRQKQLSGLDWSLETAYVLIVKCHFVNDRGLPVLITGTANLKFSALLLTSKKQVKMVP